jgi:hypothetical protein
MEHAATPATYVASGAAVVFGLTATELAAYVGIGIAVITYFTNLYYKERAARVQERTAAALIANAD